MVLRRNYHIIKDLVVLEGGTFLGSFNVMRPRGKCFSGLRWLRTSESGDVWMSL